MSFPFVILVISLVIAVLGSGVILGYANRFINDPTYQNVIKILSLICIALVVAMLAISTMLASTITQLEERVQMMEITQKK